jgi:(2Fe-2S) ferredoxin
MKHGRVHIVRHDNWWYQGGLAQLVERVLSMHEVQGSIP